MAIEHGTVKFYNVQRKFGFLYVLDADGRQTGEEIHFNLTDGRLVKHSLAGTDFGAKPAERSEKRKPEAGEQLVFERGPAAKEDKARRWAFADVWEKTIRYRVTMITLGCVSEYRSESIVWEGTDTDKLSREYPPSNVLGADPLFKLDLDDTFYFRTVYERLNRHGQWVRCADPRYRVTPVTELELAIDEENRRRGW